MPAVFAADRQVSQVLESLAHRNDSSNDFACFLIARVHCVGDKERQEILPPRAVECV